MVSRLLVKTVDYAQIILLDYIIFMLFLCMPKMATVWSYCRILPAKLFHRDIRPL